MSDTLAPLGDGEVTPGAEMSYLKNLTMGFASMTEK
jgi:hypothetical protein